MPLPLEDTRVFIVTLSLLAVSSESFSRTQLESIATVTNERGKARFGQQIALTDETLFVSTEDGGELFDASTGRFRAALNPHTGTSFLWGLTSTSVLGMAEGRLLASGHVTNEAGDRVPAVHVFDTTSGDQVAVLGQSDQELPSSLLFDIVADGRHGVLSTASRVLIYDLEKGELVASHSAQQLGVSRIGTGYGDVAVNDGVIVATAKGLGDTSQTVALAFDAVSGEIHQRWTSPVDGLDIGWSVALSNGTVLLGTEPTRRPASETTPSGTDNQNPFFGSDLIDFDRDGSADVTMNPSANQAGKVLRFDLASGEVISVIDGASLEVPESTLCNGYSQEICDLLFSSSPVYREFGYRIQADGGLAIINGFDVDGDGETEAPVATIVDISTGLTTVLANSDEALLSHNSAISGRTIAFSHPHAYNPGGKHGAVSIYRIIPEPSGGPLLLWAVAASVSTSRRHVRSRHHL